MSHVCNQAGGEPCVFPRCDCPGGQYEPRPMTGLWNTLTPEQQAAALAYDGPESHGSLEPMDEAE